MTKTRIAAALPMLIAGVALGAAFWKGSEAGIASPDIAVIDGSHRSSPVPGGGDRLPPAAGISGTPSTADARSLDPAMIARMAGLTKAFPDMAERFAALRAEARDPAWAPASERLLGRQYATLPYIGGNDRLLDIHCGTDNCVVMGDLPRNTGRREVATAMSALQSIDLIGTMMAQGYKDNGTGFGPSTSDNRQMFVSFYRRSAPKRLKLR